MLPSPPDPGQPTFFSALLSDLRPRHLITALVLVVLAIALHRAINLTFKRAIERHRARGTLLPELATPGLTISIAQPIRIGDDIELRGERGVVEDIHLIYTVLRLGDGKRLIIPNDTLANEVIKNLTMGGVTRVARVEVKVPPAGNPELLRLVATCSDATSADRLAQKVLARAAQMVHRASL